MSEIPFHFNSVSKGSLSDRIYACVVEEILRGDYQNSGKLPTEEAMAHRFGVSRPTVREALARLRSDGVIESRRGSGSHVVHHQGLPSKTHPTLIKSMADIERYYAFRICVECGATAAAAEFHMPDGLAEIRAKFKALSLAMEGGQMGIEEDIQFHLAIVRASRNPFFIESVEKDVAPIQQYMEMARRITDDYSHELARTVQAEHFAIIEAICRRSPSEASEATRAHLINAKRRIFEGIQLPNS
jgi:GntR family transcriptional repressor for pyruvate dehydrogenase complex